MSCPIKFNTEKGKALIALQNYCGANVTLFTSYYNAVVEGQNADETLKPTKAFREWYQQRYHQEPDFQKGTGAQLKNRIIRFYNEMRGLSVTASALDESTSDAITMHGYTSASARSLAKRLVANRVLSVYFQVERELKQSPVDYADIQLDKSMMVANSIIRNSELDNSTKNKLYDSVRDAESIDAIKELLEENGLRSNFRPEEANRRYFFTIAKDHFLEYLIDRIEERTGLSRDEIEDHIYDNKRSWVEEQLGGKNISLQDQNLVATYYELDSNFNDFIDEISLDSRLGDLRFISEEPLGDREEVKALDGQSDLNDENNPEDATPTNDDMDSPISVGVFDHSGTYTTALTHINTDIKNYLNSLRKLNSNQKLENGEPDYNLDNELGLPDTMNANECATMLYHYGDFSSVENMITSIEYIAQTKPGFEAFWTLAEDLRNNLDFAYAVKRTFGKLVISKVETRIEDGKPVCRIANTRSDKLSALGAEFINSARITATTNDAEYATDELEQLRGFLNSCYDKRSKEIVKNRNSADRKKAVSRLAEQLKRYYPTINEHAIENYINLHKTGDVVDVVANFATLTTLLEKTINASKITQNEYRNQQREIGLAIKHNKDLQTEAFENNTRVRTEDMIDLGPLYAKEYITEGQQNIAVQLAGELVEYSVVSLDLNSTNVLGNQSSDVINDSFLTNLRNILQNDQTLDEYGNFKFRSKQYENSNMLLEHRENGKIINRGLFRRKEDGTLERTEYAKSMLDITLYSGASNDDTNDAALYNQMSKGDYIGTAWINYFNAKSRVSADSNKLSRAAYFMRTPSDAPRNFTIYAPKYSVANLFKIANQDEIDRYKADEKARINSSPVGKDEVRLKSMQTLKVNRVDTMLSHLTTREGLSIPIPPYLLNKFKDGAEVSVILQYPTHDKDGKEVKDATQNRYVVTGTVQGETIVDAKVEGIIGNELSNDVQAALDTYLDRKLERSGRVQYTVNTDDPVFKQYKQVFKQELLDAAVAINWLFVTTDDGLVERYNEEEIAQLQARLKPGEKLKVKVGDVKFKPGMSNDGNAINGAYANYHHKGGTIIEEKDGVQRLVGNVFHSDRFVIFDDTAAKEDDKVVNYGEKILNQAFNFLYGGSTGTYLKVKKDENGNIRDVDITTEQEAIIDKVISEYLIAQVDNATKRLSEVEDALKGTEFSHANVADFILNYNLTYIGFNDLFEGDSKFYKGPQDFLKRAKEAQGSGTSYGFVNGNSPFVTARRMVPSLLNTTRFADGRRIIQYNAFRGVTVRNTIRHKVEVLESLVKKLCKTGLSEDDARTMIFGPKDSKGTPVKNFDGTTTKRKGAYQDTTINDAQSYITFAEWVRRVAGRGQLAQYKDLIDKVYSGEKLTVDELSEFIQVQKNFYYDQHYNDQSGVFNPRQIKNAEFVLVPQLIEGTELEVVAKLMDKYGIDQLNTEETSKAGKTNVLEIFDAKTGKVKEDIIEEINGSGVKSEFGKNVGTPEYYNYNYLYTQQETPQHMNAQNKAGIQIMKKIVDNIPNDPKHPLYHLRNQLFQAYCENIKGSFVDFMNELGIDVTSEGIIDLDDDGNIRNIDYKVLADRLKEEMARLGLNSNMMDYCTLRDGVTPDSAAFVMPSYHSNVSQKFENIAQSLFNRRITRQKLPGFHAAQITNVGWRSIHADLPAAKKTVLEKNNFYKEWKETVNENKEPTWIPGPKNGKYLSENDRKSFEEFLKKKSPSYAKELHYHPINEKTGEPENYIEVLVPASNFGFKRTKADGTLKTDEELLKELQDAGLDMIMGYRIPTEGKQSVCNMKVVGFVNDAYGSTIVVPDEWVAQTGSDFDIDSVYGIQYDSYLDKDGKIRKVEYKGKGDFDIYDYFAYIRRETGQSFAGITGEQFEQSKDIAKAEANKQADALREESRQANQDVEQEAWEALDTNTQNKIREVHADIQKQYGVKATKEKYLVTLEREVELLDSILNDDTIALTDEQRESIEDYRNVAYYIHDDVVHGITGQKAKELRRQIKSEKLNEALDKIRERQRARYEFVAQIEGLLSFDEFIKKADANPAQFNTREARNSGILDAMIGILGSDEMLEENLGRSNSDDLSDAMKHNIPTDKKLQRENRSPYNFLDQADFQEDTMSGAKLKGFSVSRDNFCSVCNNARPTLSDTFKVTVAYSTETITLEEAKKRFGAKNVRAQNGKIVITHDKFGWSEDNKNVVGKILTSYSSQTTAWILDAVKIGSIPNVNDVTFGVLKLFPDLGIDYDTAVAFMMQEGVSRIVRNHNKSNSIYQTSFGSDIDAAIREIYKELNFAKDLYSTNEILTAIREKYSTEFKSIFGDEAEISQNNDIIANMLLDGEQLRKNLNKPYEDRTKQLLFELGTILQYSRLSDLASRVTSAAMVLNPDKFGAKQTIFATDKIFRDINDLVTGDKPLPLSVKKNPEDKDGKNLLSAIYPGIENGYDAFLEAPVQQSAYPPLYYFLKFSTAPSIKINSTLSITQTPEFKAIILRLEDSFEGNSKLTEKQAKDYEKYIISYFYQNCENIVLPIGYTTKRGNNSFVVAMPEGVTPEIKEAYKKEERARIYGFNARPGITRIITHKTSDAEGHDVYETEEVPFKVEDIHKPTAEELAAYCELSPAQKVAWIQQNSYDPGIFGYLVPNLDGRRRNGVQTIQFTDTNLDIEDAFRMFEQAFCNKNPLIALAAYDLIKYAYVVEGFKMKKRAVNQIIPNRILYSDFGQFGTGIIDALNHEIKNVNDETIKNHNIEEDYIRSHFKSINQIPSMRVKQTRSGLELRRIGEIIQIGRSEVGDNLARKYKLVKRERDGQIEEYNSYVKLRFPGNKEEVLYKIVADPDKQLGIYLYPLNKLEENEHGTFSANPANNKYAEPAYYMKVIDEFEAENSSWNSDGFNNVLNRINRSEYTAPSVSTGLQSTLAKDIDINNPPADMIGAVDHLRSKVAEHFSDPNKANKPLYMTSAGLARYIKHEGPINGLTKTFLFTDEKGTKQAITVDIMRMPYKRVARLAKDYLGKDNYAEGAFKPKDENYRDLVNEWKTAGIVNPRASEVFIVVPHIERNDEDSGIRRSSRVEGRTFATAAYKAMERRSYTDDPDALAARRRLRSNDITPDKDSMMRQENMVETIKTTAEYVSRVSERVLNDLKYFIKDPNSDDWLSVTDPEVANLIRNDAQLRRRYIKTILDAEAVVENFDLITRMDIKSEDPEIQNALTIIRDRINDLKNDNTINTAKELFANEYLAKISTNPLIQRDILNILDGYHSTNGFTAWVGDLQETTNPLIQILSKDVIADITAKEMVGEQMKRDFRNWLRDVKKRAAAAGKTINWNNLVDDAGRWIQNYTSKLVDDQNELIDKINDAKAQHGTCSEQHLRAKLEYEKWKAKHINQELDDEYYIRKNKLDEDMLNDAPAIFVRYNQLRHQIWEINTHRVNGVLEPSLAEKLKDLKLQLDNLTSDYIKEIDESGHITYKAKENAEGFEGARPADPEAIIHNRNSYLKLRQYLTDIRDLNEEFFDYENELGFDEELEKNLKIIESYERRINGHITTPANILAESPEYVKAKEWIALNTHQVVSFKDEDIESKIKEALGRLRKKKAASKLWRIVKDRDAFVNGTIDATKLTDEDIKIIRDEQMADMDYHEENPFSDKNLIKNASPDNIFYTKEFYDSLRMEGMTNQRWLELVHKINEILLPYYDTASKQIRWEWIPNNDEGIRVYEQLNLLYSDLMNTKHKTGGGRLNKLAFKFREQNAETTLSEEEQKQFDAAEAQAKLIGGAYLTAWNSVNYAIDDATGTRVPNPYIWGSIKPKEAVREKYTDKQRTEDMKFLNDIYEQVPSEYYYQKAAEMRNKGQEAYDKWVKENHIYNPYKHTYEPIKCWMTREYKEGVDVNIDYMPNFNQTHRQPRANKVNPAYKKDLGHALNYKVGSNPEYDNVHELNEFETEVKQHCQDLIDKLVRTKQDRDFINKGYLPSARKGEVHDARFWGKELLKSMGWIEGHSGKDPLYEDLQYSRDRTAPMPMLSLFDQKRLKDLKIEKPERKEGESDTEFNKRMQEYEEKRRELKAANAKAHADAISRNWEAVIEDFIGEATHFNAVQDNKYMLFYGKSMLDNLEVYRRRYGFFGDYKNDRLNSSESETEYIKRRDDNLRQQYENWIRRIIYGQWKEPNEKFTKWASRLQSLTSAQYMMLNVRGGIANVTLGETQILAEAFAAEYFGVKDWAKGKAMWTSGIPSYFARLYAGTSISLPDAIIKYFNVVDYDEVTGRCRIVEDPVSTKLNRARNAMFSTLTIGENLMQNSAMFSMLMSHRIYVVENPDAETNPNAPKTKIIFKNLREATRDAQINALEQILKDNPNLAEKFKTVVSELKKDPNKVKDFAWFRRDLTTDFARQFLNKTQQREFVKLKKELTEKAEKEFNNDEEHPTIISQLELAQDEQMGIKKDSLLAKFDVAKEDGSPSDAYRFLAEFRGRVISVNKKIHGIYNKLGQAQLEKTWYGSLVMQYHKHMYPGILKRWRREGYYNEERGTIEKGSYIALWDFISIPFRENKDLIGMTDAEVEGMEGIQNVFKRTIDFWLNIRLNWNLLPDYEKDNIARNLGDLCGVVSALFMAVALRAIADDNEDEIWWNLALYEADRLASESFQFNPIGMYGEAKKLWSTPIAAQSGIQDLIQSCGILAHMLMDWENYDPYYHSGRFAGEHKLSVYIQRRIPIWRGIKTGFVDIVDSNQYYKLSSNMLGYFDAQSMADWITGD